MKLIQSKSALTANPAADRAKSLWKTLSNWVGLAGTPGFEVDKTIFEFYVSRPVTGTIVESFGNATTQESARAAIAQARDTLWGRPPKFELKTGVATEIASYVENVFNADQSLLERVIRNFQLTLGSGSPQADLEAVVRSHPVSPSKVNDITNHLCGMVKRHVDLLLEAGKPAVIARNDFHGWYTSYVQKIDRQTVLLSRAPAPSEEVSRRYMPDNFIQQLDIIGLSFEEMLGAASDYFMATFDRTDWAARGEVDETSFDDLDDVLKRAWKHKQRSCGLNHSGKPEEQQGQALYVDCMQFTASVQAMSPPSHFIPGCFHMLADDLVVGWHPDYEAQLKAKKVA
ncbi:ABC-three component system protein [Burkholderia cepacia]|uniref:ABC-three component system protein n=1 Tax=Burkholderia cepacia TaxID=292 RepID=UPI001FC8A4CF|nr:ABC-three component system protein [Burkholderia cepacia]